MGELRETDRFAAVAPDRERFVVVERRVAMLYRLISGDSRLALGSHDYITAARVNSRACLQSERA